MGTLRDFPGVERYPMSASGRATIREIDRMDGDIFAKRESSLFLRVARPSAFCAFVDPSFLKLEWLFFVQETLLVFDLRGRPQAVRGDRTLDSDKPAIAADRAQWSELPKTLSGVWIDNCTESTERDFLVKWV